MILPFLNKWWTDLDGSAAAEAALVFPVLLTLLLGTFDIGNGILANQKTIRASQIIADLITRQSLVADADIDEAMEAGALALTPFQTDQLAMDIISIRFDEDANSEIVWRETRGMAPYQNALADVTSLAAPNSGVLMVLVNYEFVPTFGEFITGNIFMTERAFARGRRAAVVCREGVMGCGAS